ncbi:hypothetical protein [Sphingobacterium sp. InxBP1]|nr:hypothetical protein [Sphingobacterium sp. InxBP1]
MKEKDTFLCYLSQADMPFEKTTGTEFLPANARNNRDATNEI